MLNTILAHVQWLIIGSLRKLTYHISMDILLVEDNSSDAYLLKEVFAMQAQEAEIHWVEDGYEALDYLCQRNQYAAAVRPDMVLLDINMPRINGFEVLIKVKDIPGIASIPIIILTTSRDPLNHTQCTSLGADMCLTKPHALRDYERLVQQLMQWTRAENATRVTINKKTLI